MAIVSMCDKCQGTNLSITGIKRKDPATFMYRITCSCGNNEIQDVAEQELISFLIFPDIRKLLNTFLPKPREPKKQQQTNLW